MINNNSYVTYIWLSFNFCQTGNSVYLKNIKMKYSTTILITTVHIYERQKCIYKI